MQAQFGQHVGVLGAFARQEEGEAARLRQRAFRVVEAAPVAQVGRVGGGQRVNGRVELGGEIRGGFRDNRQAPAGWGGAGVEGEGQVAQGGGGMFRDEAARPDGLVAHGLARCAPQDRQFERPVPRQGGRGAAAGVFLEDGMAVDAAEPEGAHGGAARVRPAVDPRACAGVHVESAFFETQVRVRLVAERGRQDLVAQGERHLDQARHARGGDGVADHGLEGADRAAGQAPVARAENAGHGLDLGAVADSGAGAVGFDQSDGFRGNAGGGIGAFHGGDLAFQARDEKGLSLAVAGEADSLDQRVDAVAVALGIGEPFQDGESDALAEKGAVGEAVEGAEFAAPREGAEHGEHGEDACVGVLLGAADEGHVAAAVAQFAHAGVERDDRGGAGGIHEVVGAHEVEAVGDPSGKQVGDETRAGVGRGRREARLEFLLQGSQRSGGNVRQEVPQQGAEIPGHPMGDAAQQAAVGIAAVTDDDAGTVAGERALQVAGIREGFAGHAQAQEVARVAAVHRIGHDAELDGIELRERFDESAAPAIGPGVVVAAGAGIVETRGVPAFRGVGDGLASGEDVVPQGGDVRGARIEARHADEGDLAGWGAHGLSDRMSLTR